MWEYVQQRVRFKIEKDLLVLLVGLIAVGVQAYATQQYYWPAWASIVVVVAVTLAAATVAMSGSHRRRVLHSELRQSRKVHQYEWLEAEQVWLQRRADVEDGLLPEDEAHFPRSEEEKLDPSMGFVLEVAWPRYVDGKPLKVPRLPVLPAYLVVAFTFLGLFGTRDLLGSIDTHTGLGPDQAPAVVATVVGLPGLVATVLLVVPRVIRAVGAKAKATGEGGGAAAAGEAQVIRAKAEGEAAVIRAQAELKRAEAEYLRAEKGLDPLPVPALPDPGTPPALPAPGSNGGARNTALPPAPDAAP